MIFRTHQRRRGAGLRRTALLGVAGLILAIIATRHTDKPPATPAKGNAGGRAAHPRRAASAAGPAAPARLPAWLPPRAGVQLWPSLDRRHGARRAGTTAAIPATTSCGCRPGRRPAPDRLSLRRDRRGLHDPYTGRIIPFRKANAAAGAV